MKHIRIILSIAGLMLLASCQERHPAAFQDICGVYFYNLSPTMAVTDSTDITFVYESEDKVVVPIRIQMVGRAKDKDVEIGLEVRSDNAVEGVDYILPEKAIMPAGASYVDYELTLKRTQALKTEKKSVYFELRENEHFTLPVSQIDQINGAVSTLTYRVYFSDMFTSSPKAWDEKLIGTFSQHKFELICDVMDIDPDDFNDPTKITLAKLLYISAEMTTYVKEQLECRMRGEDFDERVIDPATGEAMTFTKS